MKKERRKIEIRGIVQGVGFRPAVYRIAKRYNLKGSVFNDSKGVTLDVEGCPEDINSFLEELKKNPPPLSDIGEIRGEELPVKEFNEFKIIESEESEEKTTLVSPDISTCDDCRKELLSKKDRRYLYPFINCTNCGPRFTITKELPYDRKNTTMKKFDMCEKCRTEYENPEDRRFHAQPNACGKCGPHLELLNFKGKKLNGNPINKAIKLLKKGKTIAVKGLGGFHLACNAKDIKAITILRERKMRPYKPLALMAKDIPTIEKFVEVSEEERELLMSPRAPVVLLKKKEKCSLPDNIAPNNNFLGFMLPYTPLHILLFEKLEVLIMTSGNKRDEPIAFDNRDAIKRLEGIADYFLIHNRDIWMQADDSVARIVDDEPLLLRRSRGYAPQPIRYPIWNEKKIIGFGAHKHNTFSISRGDEIFVSHYIGETDNLETIKAFERGIEHFTNFFDIPPDIAVVDLHPAYQATKFGKKWAFDNNKPLIEVQHHHAHIASCLADNLLDEKVIGVAWDGTGYGEDGNIWGGEFLVADLEGFERKAHLQYIPLPGGDIAVKEPWRMGAVYLYDIFGDSFRRLDIDFVKTLDKKKWLYIKTMIDKRVNSPLTSSIGRLFDAVSSILGLRSSISYQGQAAIELEMIAKEDEHEFYKFDIIRNTNTYIIDPKKVIESILEDIKKGTANGYISMKFHIGLAEMIVGVSNLLREETNINKVCLSGGVFQNMVLRKEATQRLKKQRFEVYNHSKIPPNDGGISAGQVAIAMRRVK
ncbi:carbamoyltransferase HypF [candidate division WOR-3 bacterium]|nr:carbamoyltransferase HypF [candidate division WOR-3 bacterium]